MNNRRRQRIRTQFKISQTKFLKMTDQEQEQHIHKWLQSLKGGNETNA